MTRCCIRRYLVSATITLAPAAMPVLAFGAAAEPAVATRAPDAKPSVLLAQGKKKKKAKKADEGLPPEESSAAAASTSANANANAGSSDEGGGLHAHQGSSGAYKGELGFLLGGFDSTSRTSTPDGGDATKSSTTDLSVSVQYLFLFGKIGVGPVFAFDSSSGTQDQTTTINKVSSTESVKTSSSTFQLGVAGKYYLADINKDKLVPFGEAMFAIAQSSSKYGDTSTSSSGMKIIVGGGTNYFLAPRASLVADLTYTINNETSKTDDTKYKDTENRIGVDFGVSLFL